MNGQPQPYREIPISTLMKREIFEKVHNFIASLQEETLREKKHLENLECNKKCSEGPKIFNFTEHQLDKEISKQLRNGLGYVPHSKETRAAIKIRIENEIKDAAIRYFKQINGFNPPIEINKLTMGQFVKQLLILSPASHNENDFFYGLAENFESAIKSLNINGEAEIELDDLGVFDKLPNNTIISNADKNIGIALLPVQWYVEEYYRQQEKGGFENIDMSEKQCVNNLELYISKFRELCSNEQRQILNAVWPRGKRGGK